MRLPEYCATHTFKEFLQLIDKGKQMNEVITEDQELVQDEVLTTLDGRYVEIDVTKDEDEADLSEIPSNQ